MREGAFLASSRSCLEEAAQAAGGKRAGRARLVIFEENLEGASETSLARFLAAARRLLGMRGRVNVVVTTNRTMRELNRRFRAKDKPTDVLSFPAADVPGCGIAGDIAISAQIASENARSLGHKAATELKILVLHGLLHLAGFNHETDNGKMARKERKLRRELKLPDGLIERTVGVRQHSATRTKLLTQDKQSSRQGRQSPGQGAGGGRNRS